MNKKLFFLMAVLFLLVVSLAACSSQNATPAVDEEATQDLPEETSEPEATTAPEQSAEPVTLKLGLLPVLDTLPVYIAIEKGYFDEAGVIVEVVPVSSPIERDQLMQAGEIDGMLNEMTSTAVFNREAIQVQTVAVARAATADGPVFRILAAPGSDIETAADLAGVPIGVSPNSIIEYLTYRILKEEGLSDEEIVVESVPVIPERFQLLMSGQLQAATLPDPLAQAALDAGAKLIIDDSSYPFYSASVYTFSMAAIENKADGISRFLIALDQAVADLNADPDSYRALFLEKVPVPESVQETYAIPPFPRNTIPGEDQWADVLDWLIMKGLIDGEVSYTDSINPAFLPGE